VAPAQGGRDGCGGRSASSPLDLTSVSGLEGAVAGSLGRPQSAQSQSAVQDRAQDMAPDRQQEAHVCAGRPGSSSRAGQRVMPLDVESSDRALYSQRNPKVQI
jgi:hypothetical protein